MADLIKQQIIRDTNSRKNLFKSKRYKVNDMPIKPILNDAIFRVLNNTGGGANGQTAQFKKELENIIDKYSKQGLQRFSFSPIFKANNTTSIIENVARKIANSLLEAFQSTKMGPNWEWNLSFNLVDGKIKYKGRGGQLIGDSGAQTISVSLDQALTFNIGAIQGSWWFKTVHLYDNHVDDSIRWKWTKMVFNYFFQYQKMQQPQLGVIQKAQNNDIHNFVNTDSGNVAVINMESEEDTLSGRLRVIYGQKLSYKNAIFKNWSLLFGRLYALKDKRQWSTIEDREGKEYAVLLNDKVSIDGKEGDFVVGFELEGDNPFTTDRSDDYSGLTF